jgi:hypothetical protein
MRVFKIEYTIKGIKKTEWIKHSTNTLAIRSILAKLTNFDKQRFELNSVSIVSLKGI